MKLNGSYTFPIERDKLWAALMDPEIIGACVPGVQSFSAVAPDTYAFEVGFRVGIVSGAYKGTLEVRDIDAPNAYRMVVQGAGVRTDMRGEGNVALSSDDPTTTTLTFDGDVNVTGILARVGQRMMGTVAKQQIDRLFQCLSAKAGVGGATVHLGKACRRALVRPHGAHGVGPHAYMCPANA